MIDWLVTNWKDITAAFGILVAFCSAVVKLTPTQKDDTFWAKVLKILDLFSIFFTKKDAAIIEKAAAKKK
jgi:hypothetical protein